VVGLLDEGERKTILAAMAAAADTEVVADFVERPELLAGFRIQIGSRVFDGSLTGQLEQLSRQIMSEQG
jgi:F0F1-type ATP synthase delta subunit